MSPAFFDYHLPSDLIAQAPLAERDQSRLLVVRRSDQSIEHCIFAELPELLNPGDLLVLNDTRVVPARLVGRRARTGGRWEGLFLRELSDGSWEILSKSRGKLTAGEEIQVEPGPLRLKLLNKTPEGHWQVQPELAGERGSSEGRGSGRAELRALTQLGSPSSAAQPGSAGYAGVPASPSRSPNREDELGHSALQLLERYGQVPLPPYIRKGQAGPDDRERYQTVYARRAGAVAAPTAGFHFTPRVFDGLRERGIGWTFLTLHVGLGTFLPIQSPDLTQHIMHREWGELSAEAAEAINGCKSRGGKVVAVGTTSARVLETVAACCAKGPAGEGARGRQLASPPLPLPPSPLLSLEAWQGETDLYIYPPFQFRAVDALITNFHLPRTTLLLLVSAFGGTDLIQRAYQAAVDQRYRFFSYGDAMLIL